MTTFTDIVNRALQVPGTRTSVSDAELAGNLTNEAIQANLVADNIRRRLLRMAPWDCALKTMNLAYISSTPGTPENTSPATTLWQPGQPTPPWAYEYQYPVDCLRACWIIPANQTGFSGGVPITTAVTGGAANTWLGPAVKYKIQTDQFIPVTAATPSASGAGYNIGDIITLASGDNTLPPIGAPAQLLVTGIDGSGGVTSASVISVLPNTTTPMGGSYFAKQANPIAQGSTTGIGTGATFTITQAGTTPQRVILCNQEFATLVYCQNIIDPNIMDDMFQAAWANILGATLTIPLTGDKKLANLAIGEANRLIMEARTADGNEGLTINDSTPDWIRIRGVDFNNSASGPYQSYEWGNMWPSYG